MAHRFHRKSPKIPKKCPQTPPPTILCAYTFFRSACRTPKGRVILIPFHIGVKIPPFWGSDRHQEKIIRAQDKARVFFCFFFGLFSLLGDFWEFWPFWGQK